MKNSEKSAKVSFEPNLRPRPYAHEIRAATIVATFYDAEVIFKRRGAGATADLIMKGVVWELKSPIGDSKRTIANNLRDADDQSENVILDLSRSKMHDLRAISRAKAFLREGKHKIKHLKIIKKDGKILDIL